MRRKSLLWGAFTAALIGSAVIQFVPAPPLQVPALLPADERAPHRVLKFEGIANFRDLGGYPTVDGRRVRWGALYRSGTLAHASDTDLANLAQLGIATLVDFRSAAEKAGEPNRLPDPVPFEVVEIPVLDEGNAGLVEDIMTRIETGDFDGFDPHALMVEGNRQFATEFTPQFAAFLGEIVEADGAPILWHCSAGKDRTGFAAAILLRLLGVADEVIMRDYLASREPSLEARRGQMLLLRLFKGREAADNLAVLLGVEPPWLQAGLDAIDAHWGGFDAYVRDGLGLSRADVERLQTKLLH